MAIFGSLALRLCRRLAIAGAIGVLSVFGVACLAPGDACAVWRLGARGSGRGHRGWWVVMADGYGACVAPISQGWVAIVR